MAFLNLAYGSNMLAARLQQRAPGAKPIGVASLRGHELRWHKVAKDDSGKCDIVATETESVVYGVLYEIPLEQKQHLDQAEGLGSGYEEKEVVVEVGTATYTAKAYYATNIDPDIQPFTWYKALVVAGAVQHGLPPDYINKIRAIEAKQDANAQRHAQNMALAGEA